jgi:hypothetical protein
MSRKTTVKGKKARSRSLWYAFDDAEGLFLAPVPGNLDLEIAADRVLAAEACVSHFVRNHSAGDEKWPKRISVYRTERGHAVAWFYVSVEIPAPCVTVLQWEDAPQWATR